MAEEMSGREPTFCCSKESLAAESLARALEASKSKSLWSKNEQEQKPIRGFFASLRMTNKERARAKTETEADSLRE
jgi:hypothetical protein